MKSKYPSIIRFVAVFFASASIIAAVLLFSHRGLEPYGLAVIVQGIMVVTVMLSLAHLIEIQEAQIFPDNEVISNIIEDVKVDEEGNIHCPNCNTINPPQFTMCRKCNTPLRVK